MSASFLTRMLRGWRSGKPLSYRVQRAGELLVAACLTPFFRFAPFTRTRLLRAARFDAVGPGSLLVSRSDAEQFVVATGDRIVGRNVYSARQPYDFDKLERIVALLDEGHSRELIIDVGANIGTICIPALTRNLFQRAFAVEPDPFNFSLLGANVALNRLGERVVLENVALSDEDHVRLQLDLSPDNFGDHRIHPVEEPDPAAGAQRESVSVAARTLDSLVGTVDPASTLIFIDTQGFEGHVLSGATRALRKCPPLCIEFWPAGLARSGSYPALKRALIGAGYQGFRDLEGGDALIPLDDANCDALYAEYLERGAYTDLLFQ